MYFAGDTDVFEGMSELAGADAALIPVSGWGAKVGPGPPRPDAGGRCGSPAQAAPGDSDPLGDVRPLALALSRVGSRRHEDPAAEFAAAAAIAAPEVEVRILQPGERTEF